MIKFFSCPDKEKAQITDCLKKCRMGKRCLSLPTLRLVAEQRPWEGKPSTTQLLKGTREAYLEIIHDDLTEDPKSQMFRILGTKGHGLLEQFTEGAEISETRLHDEFASGKFDFYDPADKILYDYKTWGSYKVMKALGIEMVDEGTGEFYKTGAKKGLEKTHKVPKLGKPDMWEAELQLNHYRLFIEAAGLPVEQMYIEAITRDGGTYSANSRGIKENAYLIPVKRLPDDEVHSYFKAKSQALLKALETNTIPDRCSDLEDWDGRKCKDYCLVADYCDYGQKLKEAK
jgi:hypothetical protein